MQELDSDPARGRVWLSASTEIEYAIEDETEGIDDLGAAKVAGVFSSALARGLETGAADADLDGWITLDELYDFAASEVTRRNPSQTPGMAGGIHGGRIQLARNPRFAQSRSLGLSQPLEDALSSPYERVRAAAVRELEELTISGDRRTQDRARAALERLKSEGSPLAAMVVSQGGAASAEVRRHGVDAIIRRARNYRRMGRYRDAIAELNRVLEVDPDDTEALTERGETYRLLIRPAHALADLDLAIALNPRNAQAIASRGATYRWQGRNDESLHELHQAVELAPEDPEIRAQRGETYRLLGRHHDALEDLEHASALRPDDAWIIATRGATLMGLGRLDEALALLERANELKPNDYWLIAQRAEALRAVGRLDEAIAEFDRAIALAPDYRWPKERRAEAVAAAEADG